MRRVWTDALVAEAKRMHLQQHMTLTAIDEALGMKEGATAAKFRRLDPLRAEALRQTIRIWRRRHFRAPDNSQHVVIRERVPADVAADRDHRLAMQRDITSAVCGDPLPGYSALDRQRERQSP